MKPNARFLSLACFALLILLIVSCGNSPQNPDVKPPRLSPDTSFADVTFLSNSLGRNIQYRIISPKVANASRKYPVVYLLHGGGGDFRDWSSYSDIYKLAERGYFLVMPEGHSSYFTNAADRSADRYEDYITKDLITDVEQRFQVLTGRSNRAVIGVSMGGYGAIKLALVHPELYSFAAGLSPALDVPSRTFSIKRIEQWKRFRAIFGPWQGEKQKENDPFLLVKSADPSAVPYIFLACGEQEGLLAVNDHFASLLQQRKFQFEYHKKSGNHDWNQWNGWLQVLSESLYKSFPARE